MSKQIQQNLKVSKINFLKSYEFNGAMAKTIIRKTKTRREINDKKKYYQESKEEVNEQNLLMNKSKH